MRLFTVLARARRIQIDDRLGYARRRAAIRDRDHRDRDKTVIIEKGDRDRDVDRDRGAAVIDRH